MNKDIFNIISTNIPKNSYIILAFSGGADSVYLLHKLLEINKKYPLKLIIAHFNHKLRGKESDKDEIFSKKIAKKYNLKFKNGSADIKTYAKRYFLNLEDAARKKRYQFLERIRKKYNAPLIITAHHLDDNIETFLMNFLRGSGMRGFKGMQVKNNYILRPLLYVSKDEIIKYLNNRKISYRIDKSNSDLTFNRNKIRHNIIPILKEIQPQLQRVFLRNWQNLSEMFGYFDESALKWIKKNKLNENEIPLGKFIKLHPALQKAVLQKIYENIHGDIEGLTSSTLKRAVKTISDKKTGKRVPFGKKTVLEVTSKSILHINKDPYKEIKRKKLLIPGKTTFNNGEITTKFLKNRPKKYDSSLFLDSKKIKTPIYIRSRKDGDRFRPLGMKGTKKIQDIFVDKKLPLIKRKSIPVIVDSNDKIVTLGSDIISESFKITDSTKSILKISVKTTLENPIKNVKL